MLRHVWWVLGVIVVLGGLALAFTAQTPATDFGWFAYTPLDDASTSITVESSTSAVMFVARQQVVGWAVAALGLLVLAAGLGYRLGRRSGRAPARP